MTDGTPGSPEDPRAEPVRAFGRYLLRERELRGLSPDDVVRVTRLAPAVIDAIEAGDPERMPPRGYLVGYLRSYAGAVGLDADDVVLRFQEAAGVDVAEVAAVVRTPTVRAPSSRAPAGRARSRRLVIVAAVVALLVAAAVAVGFRRSSGAGEIRGHKSSERAPYRAPGAP